MAVTEERARFCNSCNAVIGWYATWCEACGRRVGEGGPPPTELPSAEKALYRAHLRLIHRYRERSERLQKDLNRTRAQLESLEAQPRSPRAVARLVAMSERLLDLEQEWENIQRGYNRDSENVEEEFLVRIEEMEADLELKPDHQQAVQEELQLFLQSLEAGEELLRSTGRFLDLVRARQRSGILGLGSGPRGTLVIGGLALLFALLGAAFGIFIARLPVKPLLASLIPGWIGLCMLFLNARAKHG